MSHLDQEITSYFDISQCRQRQTESSEAVSPLSHPSQKSPHATTQRRPGFAGGLRSHSYDPRLIEGRQRQAFQQKLSPVYANATRASLQIQRLAPEPSAELGSDKSSLKSGELPKQPLVSTDTRERHQIQRTSSTRDWRKVISQKPSILTAIDSSHGSSRSPSTRRTKGSTEVVVRPIQPLRPPSFTPLVLLPQPESRITIEKSFTELPSQTTSVVKSEPEPRRTSSIHSKHIFSAPVEAWWRRPRRFSRLQKEPGIQQHDRLTGSLAQTARGHQTNLQKQSIVTGLDRVSSMLKDMKKFDVIGRSPSASKDKLQKLSQLGRVQTINATSDEALYQSSSLEDLSWGQTPYNTPEEQATYTVINQAGIPEQYIKIDISVRGQTSYLPSEARRIHTPPLPSANRDGKRRGFFFDYDLPSKDEDDTELLIKAQTNTSQVKLVRPMPVHSHLSPRIKTGDWIATQLAEFESSSEDASLISSPQIPPDQRPISSAYRAERQRRMDEAALDHSIPEHLPTSPLCPRHPRYWRIVKGKGSQFRGC